MNYLLTKFATRVVLLLWIVTCIASTVSGQVTFDGNIDGLLDTGGDDTTQLTTDRAVSIGEKMLACVSMNAGLGGVASIADDSGNTWVQVSNYTGSVADIEVWYADVTSALAMSDNIDITYNSSSAGDSVVIVDGFSGLAEGALDAAAHANGTSSTVATGNLTFSSGDELSWACGNIVGVETFTADTGAGYTEIVDVSGGQYSASTQYKIKTSSGDENPTFTATGSNSYGGHHSRWLSSGGAESDNGTNSASTGTAVSVDVSGLTINSGDVVLASIFANGTGNTISDNNGANNFATGYQADTNCNSDTARYLITTRVAGGSEPSSYAWTLNSSDRWSVQIRVFSDIDTSSPWDIAPSASTLNCNTAATSADAPTMTTTVAGATGIVIGFIDSNTATFDSVNNGYATELEPSANQSQVSYTRTWASAGATGATTVGFSGSFVSTLHQVALAPAGGTETLKYNYLLQQQQAQ